MITVTTYPIRSENRLAAIIAANERRIRVLETAVSKLRTQSGSSMRRLGTLNAGQLAALARMSAAQLDALATIPAAGFTALATMAGNGALAAMATQFDAAQVDFLGRLGQISNRSDSLATDPYGGDYWGSGERNYVNSSITGLNSLVQGMIQQGYIAA